ncbi:hypothetical protein GF373_05235 [bacterium]|nr:hypothetical protein [bacterium]
MNYTAMKSRYKKVTNFDRVFASIILLANYGDFSYIEPFLLFAKVYYGGAPKEFPDPFQSTFISESGDSEWQDYSIWPAGYVILKHRDKAMPMLIQAAKNTSLNKVLRVRALAFIRDINETVFMNNVLTSLNDEFKKEAQESLRYGKSWKTILLLKADPASVEKRRLFYERIMKKRMGGTSVNQQR